MAENGKMETRDGREMENGEGRDRCGDAAARVDIDRILTRELGAGSRIPLEGAPNTRDLGGYRGAGGRMVKRHRLIRSGALFGLSQEDARILREEYGLAAVVDFRTRAEAEERPDTPVEGVSYVSLPVLREAQLGMTHEENPDRKISLMELVQDESTDAVGFMQKIYEALVHDAHALSQYREFFQILLRQKEGAVLWHCSAGKDRAGTAAALVLEALGVEREVIYRDYMLTNLYVRERLAQMLGRAASQGADERALTGIAVMNCAKREFLESVFGAIEADYGDTRRFFQAKMGLGPAELENLRENYLAPFPQKRVVLQ